MGNFYRVTVTDEDGATVLELAAPAGMLRTLAPSAVGAVLGAQAVQVTDEHPGRHEQAETDEAGRPRRKRRTKAEMEAARATEGGATTEETPASPVPALMEDLPERAETAATAYNPFAN